MRKDIPGTAFDNAVDLPLAVAEFLGDVAERHVGKVRLDYAEDGGKLVLPVKAVCSGKPGGAFITAEHQQEKLTHQEVQILAAVVLWLRVFRFQPAKDVLQLCVARCLEV